MWGSGVEPRTRLPRAVRELVKLAAGLPTEDPACKDVKGEGDVDKTQPGRTLCKIAHPKDVWGECIELSVHTVQRAR